MVKKVLFPAVLALLLVPFSGKGAENDTLSSILDQYQDYRDNNYREFIYVQTDKNFYLSGEFIRFSIFCLEAGTTHYSLLSKVAYLELIDTNQTAVLQTKVLLDEGRGHGEVFLPSNFESGNYILRCYTRWMQNYRAGDFYQKIVQIINPFKKPSLYPTEKLSKSSIQFFPEGGTLVAGLPARIAFKAMNGYGEGVNFYGRIIDDLGNEILDFSPGRGGLGSFKFKPEQGRTYRALLLFEDSTNITKKLPDYQLSGTVLSIDNRDPGMPIAEVYSNELGSNETCFLVGHSNETIHFTEKINIQNGSGRINIPKDKVDPGINTLTLFNPDGEPVSERLVYFSSPSNNDLKIETNKVIYGNREKVTLTIEVTDEQNNPLRSDLSLSVFAHHSYFDRFQYDVRDYMLFNGPPGPDQLPADWLYANQSDAMDQAVDDFMLTLNSHSVLWKGFSDGNIEKEHLPEFRNHIITGTVTDVRTGAPAEGIYGFLSVPSKNAGFYVDRSDENGKLYFEMNDFRGTNDIIVTTNYANDSTYRINIENPFSSENPQTLIPVFDVVPEIHSFLEKSSRNMQVQNSYMTYRPFSTIIPQGDGLGFYKPDEKYFLDDFTRFPVMEEVLREYIAGVYLRRNRNGYYLRILDVNRNETYQEDPLILLDGVPVFDADEIVALDPLYIQKIETVRQRFVKGLLNCSGIISFSTYEGDLRGYTLSRHVQSMNYDGVQPIKDYNTPDYGMPEGQDQRIPDFRNVLYWNPAVSTDEEGKAVLEFYTSDDVSIYKILIEGLTQDGRSISAQSFIEVKSEVP